MNHDPENLQCPEIKGQEPTVEELTDYLLQVINRNQNEKFLKRLLTKAVIQEQEQGK